MEARIETRHPERGKKGVSISREKYDAIRASLLQALKGGKKLSHTEIVEAVKADMSANNTKFGGSVSWWVEVVKLDLEARKVIKRSKDNRPHLYELLRK